MRRSSRGDDVAYMPLQLTCIRGEGLILDRWTFEFDPERELFEGGLWTVFITTGSCWLSMIFSTVMLVRIGINQRIAVGGYRYRMERMMTRSHDLSLASAGTILTATHTRRTSLIGNTSLSPIRSHSVCCTEMTNRSFDLAAPYSMTKDTYNHFMLVS